MYRNPTKGLYVAKKYYNGQQHGASFQIYECKEDEVAISALLSTGVSGPALHKRCTFIPKTDRFPATTILRIHFGLRLHQSHPPLSINDGNQLFSSWPSTDLYLPCWVIDGYGSLVWHDFLGWDIHAALQITSNFIVAQVDVDMCHKGSLRARKVQFFLTLFKKPLTPRPLSFEH